MEDYRLEQSGQEVQDILNGAVTQVDLTAETERATEAEQTLQGNIDAEATRAQGAEGTLQENIDAEELRAKAAEKQNADDIDALEEKVPSGASASNKLATESYVDDSVATASATFRGTYNLVSDLHLTVNATEQQIATALALAISTADNNDYCFVQVPTSSETPTEIKEIDRYKFNGTAWGFEYKLNNSGFTAAQWAAINSGITSGDVTKLAALPTNAKLTTLLAGKQDVLTFDDVPTEGSSRPVKSGGVYSAIDDEKTARETADSSLSSAIEAILLLIPSAATSLNKLADQSFVNSSIATASATFRGTYNLVTDLSLTVSATHAQIATALAGAVSGEDNNDYAFVQIPTSDATPTQIATTERYKFNGTWEYEYDLNNSGYTAAQWAAINSGITAALVTKLSDLPTNAELTTALGVLNSSITTINQKIPSAASQANQLVDTSAMEAYIVQVLDVLTASFNVTSTDGHVTVSISQVDGKITSVSVSTSDIASAASLSLIAGRVTTAEGNISTNAADIANLQDAYAALTQSALVVVQPSDTWPVASPATSTIYRVVDRENTPPQYYSDYMWNGTTMVLMATYDNAIDDMPTAGSNNLVKSGGVITGFSEFSETLFKDDLMSKVLSHDVLVGNGVMNTIPAYNGYCTDYIRVSKGELLIVDLYPTTTNPSNGWGVMWGYADKNGGSPINLLPAPNSDMYNAVVVIPEGVNYIRACSKPFPYEDNRKPCVIPLAAYLKSIGVVNLGNNVVDTKYLLASGAQQTNANYRGYITNYIPVTPGEKYYIKASTTYVAPPTFNGNIFAYAEKSTSNVVSLGSLSEENAFTFVEIPEGYNYLRVCARQNVSPYGIIIIKVTDYANVEILNSIFNDYVKTNDAALQALENKVESDIRNEIESLDCSDINNGEPVVYKTINDLNFASSVLVQSYDLENDTFTLHYMGAGNSSLITDVFTPENSSLLHIKGKVDSISLTGGAPGIGIFVANGTRPSEGKYKKVGILSEAGDFDITVDISYLVVHEQFTNDIYVWMFNETIPTEDGEVTCVISGFQVLEYENAAGGTNISGDTAHELFNSIDSQFSDIKQEIDGLSGNELVAPDGSRYILSVANNGTLVVIPVIPNKAAFFGNSLILSFGTFGMAASEASKDYYSLITNFILSKNPNFTALPRMRGADFEFLETTDATQVNQRITSDFLDHLNGDEDLIVIQLGDNVNNAARVAAFAQNIYTLLRAIRNKCQSARVVWMGMWYPSTEKYTIIENGCKGTGCEFVSFNGLRTTDAQNVIGGVTRYEYAWNWTVNNVVSLTENTPTNITFTFTVNNVQYTCTIDVISYTYSGTTLIYNGYYRVITDSGVASHPSDEGMRRIANRFLYQMSISDTEETYD